MSSTKSFSTPLHFYGFSTKNTEKYSTFRICKLVFKFAIFQNWEILGFFSKYTKNYMQHVIEYISNLGVRSVKWTVRKDESGRSVQNWFTFSFLNCPLSSLQFHLSSFINLGRPVFFISNGLLSRTVHFDLRPPTLDLTRWLLVYNYVILKIRKILTFGLEIIRKLS